jgi:hypothetical protein
VFDVAESHREFITAVQRVVAGGSDDGRAEARSVRNSGPVYNL